MRYPGFTAEASLPVTRDRQWIGTGTMRQPSEPRIVYQNYPTGPSDEECNFYTTCVNGIKYLTRDCPDGSGETVKVGVCPKPRPWLSWYIRMNPPYWSYVP